MLTATTKMCMDSRVVCVVIDVNVKAYAVVKLDRRLAAMLSFGGLLVMDATACSFSVFFFFCLLNDKKLDQMLKAAPVISCVHAVNKAVFAFRIVRRWAYSSVVEHLSI